MRFNFNVSISSRFGTRFWLTSSPTSVREVYFCMHFRDGTHSLTEFVGPTSFQRRPFLLNLLERQVDRPSPCSWETAGHVRTLSHHKLSWRYHGFVCQPCFFKYPVPFHIPNIHQNFDSFPFLLSLIFVCNDVSLVFDESLSVTVSFSPYFLHNTALPLCGRNWCALRWVVISWELAVRAWGRGFPAWAACVPLSTSVRQVGSALFFAVSSFCTFVSSLLIHFIYDQFWKGFPVSPPNGVHNTEVRVSLQALPRKCCFRPLLALFAEKVYRTYDV